MSDLTSTHKQPFFTRSTGRQARRRLLLISYHFPPGQAAGALRWEKLGAVAAERGWALDVITLSPDDLEKKDFERLEGLPDGIRVFGVRASRHWIEGIEHVAWSVYRRLRRSRPAVPPEGPAAGTRASAPSRPSSASREELKRQRAGDVTQAYYSWLDYARQGQWARRAADIARTLLSPGEHDAVITCGPPHMVHDAGRRLAAETGLPFVMDMRDPWSLVERLSEPIASPVWLMLAEKHERLAVARASLVVTNTDAVRAAMLRLYPEKADSVLAVMNGYDDEPQPHVERGRRFIIAYAGTVYLDRDPRPLFRAAARVIAEFGLTPLDFGIEFMGHASTYNGLSLAAMAGEERIGDYVGLHPPGSRAEALRFLAGACMHVSLPQDSNMAIPSKVFEYMQFHSWVLALVEPGSATDAVLRQTTADRVAPDDLDGITEVLRTRYEMHARGVVPTPIISDDRFSRRAQAKLLFDAIESRTMRSRARAGGQAVPAEDVPAGVSGT